MWEWPVSPPAMDFRATGVRIAAVYAAIFVVAGTQLPFLPIWLESRGLSVGQIAVVTSLALIVRIVVTPAIALAADRRGDHRRVLIGLAVVALVALLVLAACHGVWPILLVQLVFALAFNTMMPLTETVAMMAVRGSGLDYGRMRLWGSASFIAASLIGGVIVAGQGAGIAIWLIIAGAGLSVAAVVALPAARDDGHRRAPPRFADALRLARHPLFLVFLLASGAVQAAHAVFYTFGTLHWGRLGLSAAAGGALWSIGVIAEIGLFAWSGALARRVGAVELMALGSMAAIVRWSLMGFDPPLAVLVPLQVLHGLTYGAAHIGAMHFLARAVPDAQAGSAQALYASMSGGIAMAGAMLVAGPAYAAFGGRAYWAMALLGIAALGACAVLLATWRGGHLVADGGKA